MNSIIYRSDGAPMSLQEALTYITENAVTPEPGNLWRIAGDFNHSRVELIAAIRFIPR